MTSQLNVDTIVDKAGSGGTNVKIGNTSTYVGEGGSGSQNTVQSMVKSWLHYDQKGDSGSTQALDSFNVGSITDVGTGQYEVNVTNNFNNAFHATGAISIDSATQALFSSGPEANSSTSMIDMLTYTAGGSLADGDSSTNMTCGDLA
jgi:hypothetical protein